MAHDTPLPRPSSDLLPQNGTTYYKWSDDDPPPSWLKTLFGSAVSAANSAAGSRSRAPTISLDVDDGKGTVEWILSRDNPCGRDSYGCTGHLFGTNNNKWLMSITIEGEELDDSTIVDYCDHGADPSTCVWTKRLVIHELGHVLAMEHTADKHESVSVMWEIMPQKNDTGAQTYTYLDCDDARLQLNFDVPSWWTTSYSDCLDHIVGADQGIGLVTTAALSNYTSLVVCWGDTVTLAGTLNVATGDSHYKQTGGQ